MGYSQIQKQIANSTVAAPVLSDSQCLGKLPRCDDVGAIDLFEGERQKDFNGMNRRLPSEARWANPYWV